MAIVRAKQRAANPPKEPAKAICHPERPHKAKELCGSCYNIMLRTARRAGETKGRRNRMVALCHPDEAHYAKNLCWRCYARERERWEREKRGGGRRYVPSKTQWRRSNLRRYGITLEQYDEMLEAQGGVCAVCRLPERARISVHLCVDHDHETKRVRGLLCHGCNRAIGLLGSPEALRQAADYIEAGLTPTAG